MKDWDWWKDLDDMNFHHWSELDKSDNLRRPDAHRERERERPEEDEDDL